MRKDVQEFLEEQNNIWVDQADCYDKGCNLRRIGIDNLLADFSNQYSDQQNKAFITTIDNREKHILDVVEQNKALLDEVEELKEKVTKLLDYESLRDDVILLLVDDKKKLSKELKEKEERISELVRELQNPIA